MTPQNVNPDPSLYDEAEWEMLESFENDGRPPTPAAVREARRQRWRKAFQDAECGGYIGPVPYDVPYPWAAKAGPPCAPTPLARNPAPGDNPTPNDDTPPSAA